MFSALQLIFGFPHFQILLSWKKYFELIKAFNRLKEKVVELIAKVDLIAKSRSKGHKYLDKDEACKFLRISARTLARLRAERSIPYLKSHRKFLYLTSDLTEYLGK